MREIKVSGLGEGIVAVGNFDIHCYMFWTATLHILHAPGHHNPYTKRYRKIPVLYCMLLVCCHMFGGHTMHYILSCILLHYRLWTTILQLLLHTEHTRICYKLMLKASFSQLLDVKHTFLDVGMKFGRLHKWQFHFHITITFWVMLLHVIYKFFRFDK